MSEPDFIHTLSSGAEPTDEPLTLHPLVAEDLDSQVREMERARAEAAVSGRDYLITGDKPVSVEPVGLIALTVRNLRARIAEQAEEMDRLRKIEDAARTYFTVRGPAVITAARELQDALALPPGVVPELPKAVFGLESDVVDENEES
jgi:hypothetical protein